MLGKAYVPTAECYAYEFLNYLLCHYILIYDVTIAGIVDGEQFLIRSSLLVVVECLAKLAIPVNIG